MSSVYSLLHHVVFEYIIMTVEPQHRKQCGAHAAVCVLAFLGTNTLYRGAILVTALAVGLAYTTTPVVPWYCSPLMHDAARAAVIC